LFGRPPFSDAAVDLRVRLLGLQDLEHGMQRRLGVFQDQQAGGPEGDQPITDFRADRAATAGDDRSFAVHQCLDALVVDPDARAEQQILDRDRRELERLPGIERRQSAGGETETAGADQDRLRLRLRHQGGCRQHQADDLGVARGDRMPTGWI
jgi:hypothetical protein